MILMPSTLHKTIGDSDYLFPQHLSFLLVIMMVEHPCIFVHVNCRLYLVLFCPEACGTKRSSCKTNINGKMIDKYYKYLPSVYLKNCSNATEISWCHLDEDINSWIWYTTMTMWAINSHVVNFKGLLNMNWKLNNINEWTSMMVYDWLSYKNSTLNCWS